MSPSSSIEDIWSENMELSAIASAYENMLERSVCIRNLCTIVFCSLCHSMTACGESGFPTLFVRTMSV